MTKKELIAQVFAENPNIMKKDIMQIIDSAIDIVIRELKSGNTVIIHGFGSFVMQKRSARIGRNAASGSAFRIPPSIRPIFRASGNLIEVLPDD